LHGTGGHSIWGDRGEASGKPKKEDWLTGEINWVHRGRSQKTCVGASKPNVDREGDRHGKKIKRSKTEGKKSRGEKGANQKFLKNTAGQELVSVVKKTEKNAKTKSQPTVQRKTSSIRG